MDAKERRRKYYLDNIDRIKERSKQYYYDHKQVCQEYNRNYWSIHGYKYIEQRKKSTEYKKYHEKYKVKNSSEIHQKYVHKIYNLNIQNNNKKELIVYFN